MRLPRERCTTVRRAVRNATVSTGVLALPVAAIAGLMAKDGWRAARWATYAGAAYSVGASAFMMNRPRCTSTDALVYIWTPLVAVGGAVAAR